MAIELSINFARFNMNGRSILSVTSSLLNRRPTPELTWPIHDHAVKLPPLPIPENDITIPPRMRYLVPGPALRHGKGTGQPFMDGMMRKVRCCWLMLLGLFAGCQSRSSVDSLPSISQTLEAAGRRLSGSLSEGRLTTLASHAPELVAALSARERDVLGRGYLRFQISVPVVVEVAAPSNTVPFWIDDRGFVATGATSHQHRSTVVRVSQVVSGRLGRLGRQRAGPEAAGALRGLPAHFARPTAIDQGRGRSRRTQPAVGASCRPEAELARLATFGSHSRLFPTTSMVRFCSSRGTEIGTRRCSLRDESGKRMSPRPQLPIKSSSVTVLTPARSWSGAGGQSQAS